MMIYMVDDIYFMIVDNYLTELGAWDHIENMRVKPYKRMHVSLQIMIYHCEFCLLSSIP